MPEQILGDTVVFRKLIGYIGEQIAESYLRKEGFDAYVLDQLHLDIYDKNDDRLLSKTIEKPNCVKAVQQVKADFEKAKKHERR